MKYRFCKPCDNSNTSDQINVLSIPKPDINPIYVGDFVVGVIDYSNKDIPGWEVLMRVNKVQSQTEWVE